MLLRDRIVLNHCKIYKSRVGAVFLAAKTAFGGAVFGSIGAGQFLVASINGVATEWLIMDNLTTTEDTGGTSPF